MTDIILCGKAGDDALCGALLPALARFGGARYFGADSAAAVGAEEPKFLVYDCEQVPSLSMTRGIILFKNSFQVQKKSEVSIPPGFLCVFEPHNSQAAAALKGTDTAAVTCGTGPKDTLTLASLDYPMAALSLQRGLRALSGTVVDPHDFNVALKSSVGPRQLLAVCAVLLAAGVPSSCGYEI